MKKSRFLFLGILAAVLMFSCDGRSPQAPVSAEDAARAAELYSQAMGYFYGWDDVPFDYEKSLGLLRQAVDLGSGEAMHSIGDFYAGGYVFRQNKKKAAQWYQNAVEHGHPESAYMLGALYEFGGSGLKPDAKKAEYWYGYYDNWRREYEAQNPPESPPQRGE